jgi:hypothetical protein
MNAKKIKIDTSAPVTISSISSVGKIHLLLGNFKNMVLGSKNSSKNVLYLIQDLNSMISG